MHALGPLDLDIADGEFVCLVGPSGCGKSTFLRMVAGLIRPSEGAVELDVRKQTQPTAMVFQDYSIYPWKRVLDNARFGLDVAKVPKKEGNERAMKYLAKLGLADRARAYPGTALGRHETARRDRPGARGRARDPADGRAVRRARRPDAPDPARRAAGAVAGRPAHGAVRDPLARRSHPARRPRARDVGAAGHRSSRRRRCPSSGPATADIRNTAEFRELEAELWELLRHEVEAHLAESAAH